MNDILINPISRLTLLDNRISMNSNTSWSCKVGKNLYLVAIDIKILEAMPNDYYVIISTGISTAAFSSYASVYTSTGKYVMLFEEIGSGKIILYTGASGLVSGDTIRTYLFVR